MRGHPRLGAIHVGFLVVLAAGLGASWTPTLARFTDLASTTSTLASDTLDPPTGAAAAGGPRITLTWIASADAYAAGYNVYRAVSAGATYALVGSVSPRTTVTYVDDPGNGTFWYRVRASFQNWESVDSSTVSATSGTTPFVACISQAADTSAAGDDNGYQGNPARMCADDSSFATDTSSGAGGTESCGAGATPDPLKDRHQAWGFALGLPATVSSIDGIRVQVDLALNNTTGTTNLCAQLSWDGGLGWTAMKSQSVTVAAETTYVFGSMSDTWGRTWSAGQLNPANLRVRLIDASSLPTKQFKLDYLAASVTYAP